MVDNHPHSLACFLLLYRHSSNGLQQEGVVSQVAISPCSKYLAVGFE
jgi:hypothetical protein